MDEEFRLTSPEEPIALTPTAIEKIRAILRETRDAGIVGGIGLDVIGDATDIERQLEDLAADHDCVLAGFHESEAVNGGGYFLVERRDAPMVSSDCWLSRPEPEPAEEFPSYRGLA